MLKLALFDLDGTINSNTSRKDFIPENTRDNAAWLRWHQAFRMERLNLSLIKTAAAYDQAGYTVAVVSNRDDSLASDTSIYLNNSGFPDARYHLRSQNDNRTTLLWKEKTVQHLLAYSGDVEVHHFEDDRKVLERLSDLYQHSNRVLYIPHLVNWK